MTDRPDRSFFASGGWVLLLAVVLVAVVFSFSGPLKMATMSAPAFPHR